MRIGDAGGGSVLAWKESFLFDCAEGAHLR
jgi:hypothetical protein